MANLDELGELLALLRRRARMSQRELAADSGISNTQIGDLEKGTGGQPSPITLRGIARGLSKDPVSNDVDHEKANALYRQLMQAAGYLSGLTEFPRANTEEADVLDFLTHRSGEIDVAERLVRLARRYPELSPETQAVVRHMLGVWSDGRDV